MTARRTYALDANVFIEAARRYYAFDLAPAFWNSLANHSATGTVLSIDRVKRELERGDDELARWAKTVFLQAFADTGAPAVVQAFGAIMVWAIGQSQFSEAAKDQFAASADGWLVAFCQVNGYTLVTMEEPAPQSRKEIKIPDVCAAFGVSFVKTFDMLRDLGVKFS